MKSIDLKVYLCLHNKNSCTEKERNNYKRTQSSAWKKRRNVFAVVAAYNAILQTGRVARHSSGKEKA